MRTRPPKSQASKCNQTLTTRISQSQTSCECLCVTFRRHKNAWVSSSNDDPPQNRAENKFNSQETETKSSPSFRDTLPKYLESTLGSSVVDEKWAESEIMSILGSSKFQNESRQQPAAGHTQDGGGVADDDENVVGEDQCHQNMQAQDGLDLQQSLGTLRCSRLLKPDIGHIPSLFSSASDIIDYDYEVEKNGKFGKVYYHHDHDVDEERGRLASVVGLTRPRANCSPMKVSLQRFIIQQKMRSSSEPKFSSLEEFDIHERAEAYAASILPDPNFYILPVRHHTPISYHYSVHYASSKKKVGRKSVPRSRGRRSYSDLDCFVTRNLVERHAADMYYDNSDILPEGTRLLKPATKLVELVAKAIDGSPDGLLQVQQVYQVLMNRYPYFRFMDKTAITSWRSSIRHALYQKWFRKVRLRSDVISVRGCYWALSRHQTPKEWSLGMGLPRLEGNADDQGYSSPSCADSVDRYAFIYEPVIESATDMAESQHRVEFSQDAEDLSCLSAPSATYNQIKTELDPDPVLTTSIGSVTLPNKVDMTSPSLGPSIPKSQASNTSSDDMNTSDSFDQEYRIPPDAWWEEYYRQIGYQPVGISSSTGNYIQPAAHGSDLPDVPMCPSMFYDQGYKVECRN